jgi:hypothetical protein
MTAAPRIGALIAALAMAACADPGPASNRGFFGGVGAMVTGQDERQAQQLEQNAAAEQRRALEQRERAQQATARQQQSTRDLQAARTRLAALDADLARQRQTLARLRAERGEAGRSEAERLQRESDDLARARERAGQRSGGPTAADVDQLERLSRAFDESLRRYGAN